MTPEPLLAPPEGLQWEVLWSSEDPDYGGHSIETLIKLAHAFGCALSVKFIPYSQLALDSVDLSEKALVVKSFDDEALEFKEKK